MNLYDPADDIRYVHLTPPGDTRSAPADSTTVCSPLPPGYANRSPRTRLQSRSDHVRGESGHPAAGAPS
jgi:hypothetical protein